MCLVGAHLFHTKLIFAPYCRQEKQLWCFMASKMANIKQSQAYRRSATYEAPTFIFDSMSANLLTKGTSALNTYPFDGRFLSAAARKHNTIIFVTIHIYTCKSTLQCMCPALVFHICSLSLLLLLLNPIQSAQNVECKSHIVQIFSFASSLLSLLNLLLYAQLLQFATLLLASLHSFPPTDCLCWSFSVISPYASFLLSLHSILYVYISRLCWILKF